MKKKLIHIDEQQEISLFDILLVLTKQIKIVLIVPTVFCIIGAFYAIFISKPLYISTSKFMSTSGTNSVSSAAGIAAQLGINVSSNSNDGKWVYPEIIKSRTLAKSILRRKINTIKFGEQKTISDILNFLNNNSKKTTKINQSKIINIFLKMISVKENIKNGVYEITVEASEPDLAAKINKVIIEELASHQNKHNKKKKGQTREFIEDRIINTENELKNAEEELKDFRDRNRRIENSPNLLLEQQRLSREVTVLIGVYTTLKQQLETIKIEEVKDSEYFIMIDEPEIPLFRSKPERKNIVILYGAFGLFLGVFIVFVRNYFLNSSEYDKKKWHEVKLIFSTMYRDIRK